jgi:hypothetical protein
MAGGKRCWRCERRGHTGSECLAVRLAPPIATRGTYPAVSSGGKVLARALPATVQEQWTEDFVRMGLQIFGTVNLRYPLPLSSLELVAPRLQELYAERIGHRPTVMIAAQVNGAGREYQADRRYRVPSGLMDSDDTARTLAVGYHGHPGVFGGAELRDVRYADIAAELRAELVYQTGLGQPWTWDGAGQFLPVELNRAHVHFEPVRSRSGAGAYAARYATREDSPIIVLPGDRWSGWGVPPNG